MFSIGRKEKYQEYPYVIKGYENGCFDLNKSVGPIFLNILRFLEYEYGWFTQTLYHKTFIQGIIDDNVYNIIVLYINDNDEDICYGTLNYENGCKFTLAFNDKSINDFLSMAEDINNKIRKKQYYTRGRI